MKANALQSRPEDADRRVILNGIDWWQYETVLAIRGDRAGVRVTYLEGGEGISRSGRGSDLDPPSFIREFLDCETQTEAVRKLRAALRK